MPGGDGTGPNGEGPMTGRGLGRCRDNDSYVGAGRNYGYGRYGRRGFGFGFVRGFGFGFSFGLDFATGFFFTGVASGRPACGFLTILLTRFTR